MLYPSSQAVWPSGLAESGKEQGGGESTLKSQLSGKFLGKRELFRRQAARSLENPVCCVLDWSVLGGWAEKNL